MSGASVVNSIQKIDEIHDRFGLSFGLEMEAHAVYTAINCMPGIKPKVCVIKGVADHGDGTKSKSIQSMCSVASLIVFKELLEHLDA